MMIGKVPFGKLSTQHKAMGLAGVVTILTSVYLAMVGMVCPCPSKTNLLPVSLTGSGHRRLSMAQRFYEKNELPDKMEVTGLPEDYNGFNGLYQKEGNAGDSQLSSQLVPGLGSHLERAGSQIGSRVGCQAGSTGGARVGSTVGGELGARFGKKKAGWVGEMAGRTVGSWTGSRTGSKIGCQTGSQVGSRAGSALGAQASSQVDSRFSAQDGVSFKNKGSDAKLDYQKGQWVLHMNEKRATCPPTKNGRLPRQETWKLQDGQGVQIKMFALQVDPGHEGSSSMGAPSPGLPDSSGGNREQPKSNEENSHDSHREGAPTTEGSTGNNRAKTDSGHVDLGSEDGNPDQSSKNGDQNDDSVLTGVGGNQSAYSSSQDNLKGEVGSDVDQNEDGVRTGVNANHSADSPGQDSFKGEVGSDVDQNDDPVMTDVGANHSVDQPAQDSEVGSDVDQNADLGKRGVDANRSAEIRTGEKGQRNSGGEQNHSNQSGAQSKFTAEADMTDSNSSGTDHSIPSLARQDVEGEPETDAHEGNKSQTKGDGQKNSHDSTPVSNRSSIAKSDSAHHMKHGSRNSSLDQTNRSSLSHVDNLSTTELDYQGGNHTNITAEETTEVFSFHSILAILAAVLSLMCACVCMAVSCFWRGSDHMMKEKGGCWGVEDSETEAILRR